MLESLSMTLESLSMTNVLRVMKMTKWLDDQMIQFSGGGVGKR